MRRIFLTAILALSTLAAHAGGEIINKVEWIYENVTGQVNAVKIGVSSSTTGNVMIVTKVAGGTKDVVEIKKSGFANCHGLTGVTIPDCITNIGDGAFLNSPKVTNIVFEAPQNVKGLGRYVFRGCAGIGSMELPGGLAVVPNSTFKNCTALTNVVIGDGIAKIDRDAFFGCTSLVAVTIPQSVTNVRNLAFHGCTGLKTVNIPTNVTYISGGTFGMCESLLEIKIPEGVTTIDDFAFEECHSITNIDMPLSVTNIGYFAFGGCSNLERVTFHGNAPLVGRRAFEGVKEGCTANFKYGTTGWGDYWNPWNGLVLRTVTPVGGPYEDVYKGVAYTFAVTNSGSYKYAYIISANEKTATGCVELPPTLGDYPAEIVSNGAFTDMSGIEKVIIPYSYTTVGSMAFERCYRMKEVDLEESSVTNFGAFAFRECIALTSFDIPSSDGMKIVPVGMFSGCGALTNVVIGSHVEKISDGAFSGCGSLGEVKIPASVSSIGTNAFNYCSSVTNFIFDGEAPEVGYQAFNMVGPYCKATVHEAHTNSFKTTNGTWNGLWIHVVP